MFVIPKRKNDLKSQRLLYAAHCAYVATVWHIGKRIRRPYGTLPTRNSDNSWPVMLSYRYDVRLYRRLIVQNCSKVFTPYTNFSTRQPKFICTTQIILVKKIILVEHQAKLLQIPECNHMKIIRNYE